MYVFGIDGYRLHSEKKNHFKGEVCINCHNRFNIKSRPMICEKKFLHAHC